MTHTGTRPITVLIAAAEDGYRRQQASWLEERGQATVEAIDGVQAWQILQQGRIAAALVEVDLPHLSGIELLRQAQAAALMVPIILCTRSWNINRAVEAMKEGAWSYLTRPFPKKELVDAVAAALEGPGSRQAPWGWREQRDRKHAQKLEILGRIAGGVIHDFNNILAVIMGFGQVLRDRIDPAVPWRAHVLELISAAEHGASLTNQLLSFCHNRPAQPAPLDVNAVVRKLQTMLTRSIGERITIVHRLAGDLGTIQADVCQLEQVIMNLALNARDAMPRGGCLTFETANVDFPDDPSTASLPPGSYVMLSVSDTGAGMTDETKSHLFEPFYTTKADGTGLGLSNVQRIIRANDGHIAVTSEPERGTTFSIFWPRITSTPEPMSYELSSVACGEVNQAG